MKAVWNGKILAESSDTMLVEGNHYFPAQSIRREFFVPSETTSQCFWKGQAHYYNLLVDGRQNPDAAWYYPEPKAAANTIKNHIAFWRGVKVST